MKYRRALSDTEELTDINISPLIDMVFILLIFFIVTTVFVEETGVEVDKPQAASAVELEKNSILIAITAKGEVVYDGRNVGVNGAQAEIRRLVLKEKLPVILQVDQGALGGLVVRVIDAAKLAGAKSVNISADVPETN